MVRDVRDDEGYVRDVRDGEGYVRDVSDVNNAHLIFFLPFTPVF